MTLGEIIRAERKKKKLTQNSLLRFAVLLTLLYASGSAEATVRIQRRWWRLQQYSANSLSRTQRKCW